MTEQDTREPIDVRTEAESIANLIAARRYADAFDALATAKENQPLSLQEALDRQVYSRSRESLATLRQSADYATHREDVDRLEQAVQFVRFPTGAEMAELANESQRHDVYASVIMLRGNNAARTALTTVNERSILGLRQENSTLAAADPTDVTRARPDDPATTQADESRRGTGVYDDRIVVLWTDAAGGRHVHEANRANTEPTAQYDHHNRVNVSHATGAPVVSPGATDGYQHINRIRKIEGSDVNEDGIRDLGRLAEGTVEMRIGQHPRPGSQLQDDAFRPTQNAVANGLNGVQRDSNADGWYTAQDIGGYAALNDTFKMHRGSRGNTDSAGCQTIHYDDYDAFMDAARGSATQTRWQYVLVNTTPGMFRGIVTEVPQPQPEPQPAPRQNGEPPQGPHDPRQAQPPHEQVPGNARQPERPAHPDQAKLDDLRGRIEQLHAQHGLSLTPQQADNAAAALLLNMQKSGVKEAARVDFSVHAATQQVNPQGNLIVYAHYPLREYSATAAVPVHVATSSPAEASLRELEDVKQQHAERDLAWQQQRERANAQEQSHGPGPLAYG